MSRRTKVKRQCKQPPSLSLTPENQVNTDLLTRAEAARYLRMSRGQFIKTVRSGAIAEVVVNQRSRLYKQADLDAFVNAHRVEATKEAA